MTDLHPVRIVGVIILQCILVFLQEFLIPSFIITGVYVVVMMIGFISGLLAYLQKNHFLRLVFVWSSLAAMLFFASLRAWMILFENSLLVSSLLIVILSFIGALPYLNREWSDFIYWEQLSPKTKGGKFFQRFMILVVVVWTFIARGGITFPHGGGMELLPHFLWYMAILMYIGSAAFTFFAVYLLTSWKNALACA
jgi:hypothetical protein